MSDSFSVSREKMAFTKTIHSIAVAIENRFMKRFSGNSEYTFTADYVSWLIPIWEQYLYEFKGKENISLLEIGSFEGRSAIWFLENILTHPTSSITCVDHFLRSGVRFDHNIKVSGLSGKVVCPRMC